MSESYAILDATNGWLINLVMWDGNTETWQPPSGTVAIKVSEIDLHSLPPTPSEFIL